MVQQRLVRPLHSGNFRPIRSFPREVPNKPSLFQDSCNGDWNEYKTEPHRYSTSVTGACDG